MAERGLVSAPHAATGLTFPIGGQPTGFYPLGAETGLQPPPQEPPPLVNNFVRAPDLAFGQESPSPFDQGGGEAGMPGVQ